MEGGWNPLPVPFHDTLSPAARSHHRDTYRYPSGTLSAMRHETSLEAWMCRAGDMPTPFLKPLHDTTWKPIAAPFHRGTLYPSIPSPSMSPFLTVKQAAQFTGKSSSSIRRLLYPIIADDAHPDRTQIEPSVADVSQLRSQGENFAWRLSEELLRRVVVVEAAPEKGTAAESSTPFASSAGDFVSMLREELAIKNIQIAKQAAIIDKQMELVNGLSERLREGNLLIGNLQQHLALTDGRPNKSADMVKTKQTTAPGKGSTVDAKVSKPKKGFFRRIFGK